MGGLLCQFGLVCGPDGLSIWLRLQDGGTVAASVAPLCSVRNDKVAPSQICRVFSCASARVNQDNYKLLVLTLEVCHIQALCCVLNVLLL